MADFGGRVQRDGIGGQSFGVGEFDRTNQAADGGNGARRHAQITQAQAEQQNHLRRYLLVGGIALLKYIEGRNTEDIDLIMAVSSLDKLPEIRIVDQNEYFARGEFNELQIDLLLTRNSLFDKVKRDYAATQQFVEQDIPCATVEGLLLLKMYALPSLYRQGNFARVGIYENDIATLMQLYQPELSPLFSELSKHLSATDLKSVREIVDEIQQRIARFRQRSNRGE